MRALTTLASQFVISSVCFRLRDYYWRHMKGPLQWVLLVFFVGPLVGFAQDSKSTVEILEACHPERSEGPCHNPASSTTDETRLASAPAPSAQPNNAPPPAPPPPQPRPTTPNHDPYAVRYDHSYRLRRRKTLLKSTLTVTPRKSKFLEQLSKTVSPLSATLTKNPGRGC